jgi:hypothetical protein
VVVWVGFTEVLPDALTVPTPGWIVTVVAFCTTQVRVEVWPGWMFAGFAVNCRICTWLGVAVDTVVVADDCNPSVLRTVRRNT